MYINPLDHITERWELVVSGCPEGESKQTAGMLSSDWCKSGAIQLKPKALIEYLGKSTFNLVFTLLETETQFQLAIKLEKAAGKSKLIE